MINNAAVFALAVAAATFASAAPHDVLHTTTHIDRVRHRGHTHRVPHTTTHVDHLHRRAVADKEVELERRGYSSSDGGHGRWGRRRNGHGHWLQRRAVDDKAELERRGYYSSSDGGHGRWGRHRRAVVHSETHFHPHTTSHVHMVRRQFVAPVGVGNFNRGMMPGMMPGVMPGMVNPGWGGANLGHNNFNRGAHVPVAHQHFSDHHDSHHSHDEAAAKDDADAAEEVKPKRKVLRKKLERRSPGYDSDDGWGRGGGHWDNSGFGGRFNRGFGGHVDGGFGGGHFNRGFGGHVDGGFGGGHWDEAGSAADAADAADDAATTAPRKAGSPKQRLERRGYYGHGHGHGRRHGRHGHF